MSERALDRSWLICHESYSQGGRNATVNTAANDVGFTERVSLVGISSISSGWLRLVVAGLLLLTGLSGCGGEPPAAVPPATQARRPLGSIRLAGVTDSDPRGEP